MPKIPSKKQRLENSISLCLRTITSIEISGGEDSAERIGLVQIVLNKRTMQLSKLKYKTGKKKRDC